MTLGMVEQHRAIACRGLEITGPEGDRARPLAQHAAKRQGLPDAFRLLDIVLDHTQCLIGISLQPQDARLEIVRRHPQIEPRTDDLGLPCRGRIVRERAVDMTAGIL